MNAIDNIDILNDIFYNDHEQRRHNITQVGLLWEKISQQLAIRQDSILALNRSWFSEYLIDAGKNVKVLPSSLEVLDRFDIILAIDEIFTRASTETEQKTIIEQLVTLLNPGGIILASLRDYRNTNCHRRLIADSVFANLDSNRYVITELNEPDMQDKQKWNMKYHVVINDNDFSCLHVGPRRTLYFKQLAKYCLDNGMTDFASIKEGYWRNHLRRMPEHIVYARKP